MWPALGLAAMLVAAAAPARPTAKTIVLQVGPLGALRGKEMALSRSQKASAFFGIPYAQPPIGDLRFKEPQKPEKWIGTRDATDYKPSCLQPTDKVQNADRLGLAEKLNSRIDYHEDCLYLNIFVPDGRPPNGQWPVLIWFHPGDFVVGTPAIWDGSTLAIKQKVIIITASYRLNIFGFMVTKDNQIPGNLGLLDQSAVIEWVEENIRYFNGSKDDVTLWGHSSGAISISLHLLSERSLKKFQRAIIMSGNFFKPNVIRSASDIEQLEKEVLKKLDCKDPLLRCLQELSAEKLLSAGEKFDWGPTLSKENTEYTYISEEPEQISDDSDIIINDVPIMMGYTDVEDLSDTDIPTIESENEFKRIVKDVILGTGDDNETCIKNDLLSESVLFYYLPELPIDDKKTFLKRYLEMLTEQNYASVTLKLGQHTSKKSETYIYRFDYKLRTTGLGDVKDSGVPQQYELPLFWGMPYWTSLSPPITWNSQDKRISDVIMGLLGNFTKYSKPAENRRTLQWDPWDIENPRIFIIDKNPNMSSSETFNYKSIMFWNEYYPRLKNHIKTFCSLHNAASSKIPRLLFMNILLTVYFSPIFL